MLLWNILVRFDGGDIPVIFDGQFQTIMCTIKIQIQMIKTILALLLISLAWGQSGSIQLTPNTPTLWAQTSYLVSYYTFYTMPSASTFVLNFSSTYITIPSGTINISTVLNSTPVTGAVATCSGSLCTIKLNRVVVGNTNIKITIGSFTNPYFLRAQPVTASVTYNATYTESLAYSIGPDQYSPMPITSNSLKQSDYGVGNTGVNYVFNFSVPMSPSNVQLSLTIPPQVSLGTVQTSLVYYGAVQYAIPVFVGNIIVLTFTTNFTAATSPSGFILLNVSGLTNPQSIGQSNSFILQILVPTLPGTMTTCSNCAVAQLTGSLFAKSTVPGNIQTINMFSSNSVIGQSNNITIYSMLYASIPIGGIYQILLPSSIRPVLPVYCSSMYGFEIANGATPSCSYNSTNNAIYTKNFVFSGTGSVVITVSIVNPPDTTQANFYFQSFDATANMIGNSTTPYSIVSVPLPLNVSAVKTNYQVESGYRMTVNCTLGVTLTPSNKIQVILPQAGYTTSGITCFAGTTVPCTTSVDPLSLNLTVSLTPPCSPCSVGTAFSFAIDGLTNPSFINSYSQAVVVQSATSTGIIETSSLSSTLSPSTLTISNYTRSGANIVGSTYSMSFTYTISNYINQNGGMLLINFNPLDTFVNPFLDTDGSYAYPSVITITDPQNNQYTNSLTYYTTSNPNSLQQIAINICGGSNCAGSITISGLRKGFNPLSSLTQNIQITTVWGDSVSTSTFNAIQFNVAKVNRPLTLSLSNSVTTLTSNYVIDFISASVPFQSGLTFSLSSLHTINGGCFLTHNATIFIGVFSCQVLNTTSVSLTYTGDTSLMMLQTIDYTLSIINVVNPISVVSLPYQLATQFSSTTNSQWSTTYAIQTPLPLNFLAVKSNNTFGQAATINITIVSNYPTFNQIRMVAGSNLMSVMPSSSATTSYQTSMVNNAYQITQIYTITNQSVILSIINPNTTGIAGVISLSMYNAGSLSATGSITIQNVVPMFLGLSTATNTRIVGDTANLTVNFLRVNSYSSESQFMLSLTSALYDISGAQYNGVPITFPIAIPIGLTSIIITNLKNLLYIPLVSPSTGISAWTLDSSYAIVATTSSTPANLVPNTPATAIGSAFTRTNTVINGVGSININYTPRFPTATSIMTITLPQSQTTLVSPACSMQGVSNSAATCSVLSSNTTSITLSYFNQTSTILNNVVNVEPNSNQLKVSMFTTNNQLVETGSGTITPTIQYNALTLTAFSSSTTVATNNQLQFNITSPSPIDVGSRIVINVPTGSFTRLPALISQDCKYSIGGASYTGCQCAYQGIWLTQVNLTAFGTTQLAASTVIVLTIFTTNAWSVVPFGSQSFTVLVSNPSDSFVAQGSISLVTVFGGIPSLNPAAVTNASFSQLSTSSNIINSLTVTFSLGIALLSGSVLNIYLPKSAYSFTSSSSAVSNLQGSTENTTYYALTTGLTCSQAAPLCNLPNSQYSLTLPVQNNPYSQIQNSPIAFQITLASNQVTAQSSLPLQSFTPQTLTTASASISRSNLNAFANTNVTIVVPNPNTVSAFTLLVSPLVKSTATLPLILAPTYAGIGSSFSFQLNTINFLNVSVTGVSGPSSTIVLSGQNNLLVSSTETYTITIVDSNFVYFTGQVTTSDTLLPYTSGLSLQRTVTTVDASTNVYLQGNLPSNLPSLSVSFNGISYTVPGGAFNISLGTMTNSNNISDSSTYPIVIKNSDFTAFSSSLPISPSLTPQAFTALTSISMPSVVNVSSAFNITVSLNSPSLTYLSIKTGSYFKTLTKCCIDTACSQVLIKSCTLVQNGGNFIELWLISPQNLTSIIFQVIALDYQSTYTNQTLSVTSALPTAFTTTTSNLTITAANIYSSLAVLNWRVNSLNTYTLSIQPIAKSGYMQITLPNFISKQLAVGNGNATFTLTINGTLISANMNSQGDASTLTFPVSPSSSNIVLLMTSITNPVDSSPNSIIVTQTDDQSLNNVYGYTKIGFSMKQFDQITLVSAIRVVTKVNVATSLILQATAPYASNQFVISFPSSQLLTTSTCSILSNQTKTLPCQVINSSAILTSSLAGTSRYTINGLQNQKFYNTNSTQDLISAQIGSPYTKATTLPASSTFITPHLTLGSIVVNSMTSSSNVMLAKTTLNYNITIENINNINGFLLVFANYHYIFSPTLACSINNEKIACTPTDNHTLFIPYASPQANSLIVTVSKIVNFIQPSDWTFKSVQTYLTNGVNTYSDVDLYYNDGQSLAPFQSSAMVMRIILPFNYVHSSPVTFQAIIDSEYSSFLPLSSFALNFTTQTNGCQLLSSSFASSLTIICSFPESTNYKMKLQLYHTKFPSTALSVGTSNLFIYPTPGGVCSNQMCDSCSFANGQEYCFSCREGLYSSNGQCSSSCSTGSFPYSDTNICQPCSPTCSNCFGLYSSQCLSCSDTTKTLSSGECVESCPAFTYAYNGFCVSSEECSGAEGCRLCSNTGFCYQCLPDYIGAPKCKYVNVMPPTIMVYFIAPLAGLAVISIIIAAAKCVGADSLLSQSIFSFSMVELFAWVFTVPIMHNIMTAMALVAFLTLRIIISIVSYEVFYKKNMGELSQKLLEEQSQKEIEGAPSDKKEEQDSSSNLNNWKTKLVRLTAHFNGPDSYQLLKCRIAEPVLAVSSSLAIDAIFMLNRWVVCVLMFYMASIGTVGDSVLMPIFVVANAGLLTLFRLLGWEKVRRCLSACRS